MNGAMVGSKKSSKGRQGERYNQNTLYTCVKLPKNTRWVFVVVGFLRSRIQNNHLEALLREPTQMPFSAWRSWIS